MRGLNRAIDALTVVTVGGDKAGSPLVYPRKVLINDVSYDKALGVVVIIKHCFLGCFEFIFTRRVDYALPRLEHSLAALKFPKGRLT